VTMMLSSKSCEPVDCASAIVGAAATTSAALHINSCFIDPKSLFTMCDKGADYLFWHRAVRDSPALQLGFRYDNFVKNDTTYK
jgi:hypothetical protein